MTKTFNFKLLEIVKRDGPHPCMLIGHLHRNNRPGTSTLLKKFKKLDDDCDGFIDKIRNPACIDGSGADVEVPFIEVPVSKSGAVTTSDDETGLCAMFQHIKENNNANEFRGHFECIDQARYEQIQSQENDFGEVAFDDEDEPGAELSKNKRKASDIPEKRLRFVDSILTASNAEKDAKILELTTAAANLETKCGEMDRLRRLVEKTKEELAARDAEILELRKPSTAGPASAKDQHPGLLQFKAGAGKYDAAMKQVRDLEAKLKTATDEMNRLYGEVNRLEQELERAAPAPSSAGGGGPGWADQFVLSNAKKHLEELQRLPMHEQTKKVLRLEAELLDKEVAIIEMMSGDDRSISHAHQTQWASIMKKIQEDAELKHCRYREKCLQNPGRLPGGYGGKR